MMETTSKLAATDLGRSLFHDFFGADWVDSPGATGVLPTPRADVKESKDEIIILLDLPGFRSEDLDARLEDNVLTVSGENKEEEDEELRCHLSERRFGRFSRSFAFPKEVEQDKVKARLANGVLELRISKKKEARPRRIKIQKSGKGRKLLGRS